MHKNGFTMVEMLVALAVGGLIVAALVPALADAIQRANFDTAVRHVVTDVRQARSRAITTGWQFRIIGFDAGSSGSTVNQYRLLGRRSTAVAWPSVTATPFTSATQIAENWVEVGSKFPGVELDVSSDQFSVTFDARGAATASSFNPMTISHPNGRTASLSVTVVGGINIQ